MLIDLGFCKKFVDEENRHIAFRRGKPITGTARYISVNNHAGCELSRRDDLEALLYMIVFLHKGTLPWQGLPPTADVRERYRQVAQIKADTAAAVLCSSMPPQYAAFHGAVKRLAFEERPPYEDLRATFYQALLQMGVSMADMKYDWNEAQEPKSEVLAALAAQQPQQQQQPQPQLQQQQ